ncbi:hypothetical protein A3Q56_01730 [Intoshia linei]|uniref:RNA helicase n=1 Tax=Intoshia linei TaxID=1819745 RepID=A0A177B889_9BILA|nr:hypothetical protein A3Q56_01730 [Intoshia linei]
MMRIRQLSLFSFIRDLKNLKECRFFTSQPEEEKYQTNEKSRDDFDYDSVSKRLIFKKEWTHGNFNDFDISKTLLKRLEKLGYLNPSEIQFKTLKHSLGGRDIIGSAMTGSGKTLAFSIPVIEKINKASRQDINIANTPHAFIISPTRELCAQSYRSIMELNPYLRTIQVYGGASKYRQEDFLRRGVSIVCATPGRLIDHIESGNIKFDKTSFIVLDEADELLNPGFKDQLFKIFERTPSQKQVFLFTATMTDSVQEMSQKYMNKPEIVNIHRNAYPENISHFAQLSSRYQFVDNIVDSIKQHKPERTIVFVPTKFMSSKMAEKLNMNDGIRAHPINSNLSQFKRNSVMHSFRQGQINMLVATDVAARGIDIPEVDMIIQAGIPQTFESYVHRTGRTGRAGRTGTSIILYTRNDKQFINDVSQKFKLKFIRVYIDLAFTIDCVNSKCIQFSNLSQIINQNKESNIIPNSKSLFLNCPSSKNSQDEYNKRKNLINKNMTGRTAKIVKQKTTKKTNITDKKVEPIKTDESIKQKKLKSFRTRLPNVPKFLNSIQKKKKNENLNNVKDLTYSFSCHFIDKHKKITDVSECKIIHPNNNSSICKSIENLSDVSVDKFDVKLSVNDILFRKYSDNNETIKPKPKDELQMHKSKSHLKNISEFSQKYQNIKKKNENVSSCLDNILKAFISSRQSHKMLYNIYQKDCQRCAIIPCRIYRNNQSDNQNKPKPLHCAWWWIYTCSTKFLNYDLCSCNVCSAYKRCLKKTDHNKPSKFGSDLSLKAIKSKFILNENDSTSPYSDKMKNFDEYLVEIKKLKYQKDLLNSISTLFFEITPRKRKNLYLSHISNNKKNDQFLNTHMSMKNKVKFQSLCEVNSSSSQSSMEFSSPLTFSCTYLALNKVITKLRNIDNSRLLFCLDNYINYISYPSNYGTCVSKWIYKIDTNLSNLGWQDDSFIWPPNIIFLFMLLRDQLNKPISGFRRSDCGINEMSNVDIVDGTVKYNYLKYLVHVVMFISYSYQGAEISYPSNIFHQNITDKSETAKFWAMSVDIYKSSSKFMLLINKSSSFLYSTIQDLLAFEKIRI